MQFAITWIDLETFILREVRQRQISYITYVLNLKIQMNLLTKQEGSQKSNLWLLKGKCQGEGISLEFKIDIYTLLYLKQIN